MAEHEVVIDLIEIIHEPCSLFDYPDSPVYRRSLFGVRHGLYPLRLACSEAESLSPPAAAEMQSCSTRRLLVKRILMVPRLTPYYVPRHILGLTPRNTRALGGEVRGKSNGVGPREEFDPRPLYNLQTKYPSKKHQQKNIEQEILHKNDATEDASPEAR